MRLLSILFCLLISTSLLAQQFVDVTEDQGILHNYVGGEYGGGTSFYDVDGDGWDDITLCGNLSGVRLYRNEEGIFDSGTTIVQSTDEIKSAHWVDYDNDGDADLFVTSYLMPWKLYQNNGSVYDLVDVTSESLLPSTMFYETMGHSWADINKDGHLDLYICNYNTIGASNFLFLSNGDGTFTDVTDDYGVSDSFKSSFQSMFFDYNHNGQPDLFVINDREPFSNSLFKGEIENFSDITTFSGMEHYICAMNTSIADYDKDGDFDIYISNSTEGNYLMNFDSENSSYTNLADDAGVAVYERSWSALWVDFDNDGWEDLHVSKNPFAGATGQNRLFQNNQDGTFTNTTDLGYLPNDATSPSYSSAMADFNGDGFTDIIVLNEAPFNSQLLQNVPTIENNFIKINLEGTISNRDAIGTWMEVWTNGEKQIRYTQCGEGYLTQNSKTEIIGIGTATNVDSIRFEWPNGLVEMLYDIPANEKIEVIEGDISLSLVDGYQVINAETSLLCGTDSLLLVASAPGDITWNNEVQTDSLWVTQAGDYFYTFTFLGVDYESETITINGNDSFSANILSLAPLCYGENSGSLSFELGPDDELTSYSINDEVNGPITNLSSGVYNVILTNQNACEYAAEITVDEPAEFSVEYTVNQALCFGEVSTVDASVTGGQGSINYFWIGFNPQEASPGVFFPYIQDENGCEASGSVEILEVIELETTIESTPAIDGNTGTIALTITGGAGNYDVSWSGPNGFTSSETNLSDLEAGFYTVIVQDENGCISSSSILVSDTFIQELDQFQGLVYPIPATKFLFVESSLQLDQLQLFDLSGRKQLDILLTPGNLFTQLNVEQIASGMYILLISQNGQVYTQRVILN